MSHGKSSKMLVDSRFLRTDDGRLSFLDADGQRHADVTPQRLFPLTAPEEWISIFDCEGREIACIPDVSQLQSEDRGLLAEELSRREFVPEILQVRTISGHNVPCQWDVITDRGTTQFILKDEKDVRRVGHAQILVVDAHGIRYLIRHPHALDSVSRRFVERYI